MPSTPTGLMRRLGGWDNFKAMGVVGSSWVYRSQGSHLCMSQEVGGVTQGRVCSRRKGPLGSQALERQRQESGCPDHSL